MKAFRLIFAVLLTATAAALLALPASRVFSVKLALFFLWGIVNFLSIFSLYRAGFLSKTVRQIHTDLAGSSTKRVKSLNFVEMVAITLGVFAIFATSS